MTLKINKNYLVYTKIAFLILLDAFAMCFIKNNITLFVFHSIANIIALSIICVKKNKEDCIIFSILFMLLYTFFIDVFIHYFHFNIIFETEYLYCIPLLFSVFKTKNINSKFFVFVAFSYIVLNALFVIINQKVDAWNYFIFLPYILTFVFFYYLFNNLELTNKFKDLYKYLFMLCFVLTIFQTLVGFNQDTRNGIFSVFGWGAYTIFIMFYVIYCFAEYLRKNSKIKDVIKSIILCSILFICTESKAAIVIMFVSMIIMTFISKGISIKKLLIIVLAVLMVPISFNLLIKYNPKFSYLTDINRIIRYYTGNNDWKYQYGRFQALQVAYNDLENGDKLFGIGFGSSIPLNHILYEESNRIIPRQYYINKYGYRHGFQNTSTATAILDGGLFLFTIIIIFLIKKIGSTIINISRTNSLCDLVKFGMSIYVVYLFAYNNIFKDFRYLAIIGIILGMQFIKFDKNEEKKVGDIK